MRSIVVIAFFCLVGAFAQFQLLDLPLEGSVTGSLLPTTEELAVFPSAFYRLYLPENATSLTVSFTQTGTTCTGDIRYYIHGNHIPCGSKFSIPSGYLYPCTEALTTYFDSVTEDVELFPGYNTENYGLRQEDYVYISLVRDSPTFDYNEQCDYTIETTVVYCTTAGQKAIDRGSSTAATCGAVDTIELPYAADWNVAATEAFFKFWVPAGASRSILHINNTDSTTSASIQPRFASSSYYYCYDSASYVDSVYQVELVCYNLPEGWAYLYVESSTSIDGNVTFSIVTCDSDKAGFNCSYPAYNVTGETLNGDSYTIADEEIATFYLESSVGYTGSFNFTATLTAGTSSYLYHRNSGFISTSLYDDYTSLSTSVPETIALTPTDLALGRTQYIGVSNEGSGAAVTFTAASSSAGPIGPTTADTTTGGETTSTTGSGAAAIIVSFNLIAAMIFALF